MLALSAFTFAKAQDMGSGSFGFSEGNILVEGNLGFNSNNDKNNDTKSNSFTISPKVGYFVTDKFAVGAQLGYASSKEETAGVDTDKNSVFTAGVFGRYYFLDLGQRFKTYTDLGVDFASGKNDITDVKANGVGIGAGIGVNYFVTDCIVLNFALRNCHCYRAAYLISSNY